MARILIIDDDPTFGELMVRRLEKGGHEPAFRASPFGSLNEIKKGSYEVVIVDVNMPALDGAGLVRLIRETGSIRITRILLCSSMDAEELNLLSMSLMADGYISKSATATEVLDKLKEILEPSSRRPSFLRRD